MLACSWSAAAVCIRLHVSVTASNHELAESLASAIEHLLTCHPYRQLLSFPWCGSKIFKTLQRVRNVTLRPLFVPHVLKGPAPDSEHLGSFDSSLGVPQNSRTVIMDPGRMIRVLTASQVTILARANWQYHWTFIDVSCLCDMERSRSSVGLLTKYTSLLTPTCFHVFLAALEIPELRALNALMSRTLCHAARCYCRTLMVRWAFSSRRSQDSPLRVVAVCGSSADLPIHAKRPVDAENPQFVLDEVPTVYLRVPTHSALHSRDRSLR